MGYLQSLLLSIVQGITEFLPISSSGHLILIPKFFGWQDQGLAFDAIVHVATSAAVIIYYRNSVLTLIRGVFQRKKKSLMLAGLLLLSAIPAALAGIFLKDFISGQGRSVLVVMLSLTLWGIVLILVEYYAMKRKKEISIDELKWKHALIIGIAQAFALIPGTSRSGITLSAGIFLDLKKEDAVKFSFLMSVPVILGAGALSFFEMLGSGTPIAYGPLLLAMAGAFVSGMFAIHILTVLVKQRGLIYFGIYRILLAAFLFFTLF